MRVLVWCWRGFLLAGVVACSGIAAGIEHPVGIGLFSLFALILLILCWTAPSR